MSYTEMDGEDVLNAIDGMRDDLSALHGMLGHMAEGCTYEEVEPGEDYRSALVGIKLIVDRQLDRLERHYDEIAAKFVS